MTTEPTTRDGGGHQYAMPDLDVDWGTLSPAEKAIRRAGGIPRLADLLGIDRGWVWKWTQPCWAGGTEGRIPHPQQRPIMRLSRELGWGLTAEDILGEV